MFVIRRSKDNPVLLPRVNHPWEAMAAFNWCPVTVDGKTRVLYRAMTYPEQMGKDPINTSSVGVAELDKCNRVVQRKQLIKPDTRWDKCGCEDPRATLFEGKYYIFYTALSHYPFDADGIKVAAAVSQNCQSITEKHLVTPFNAKATALFPDRVDGKIALILTVNTDRPPSHIAIATFDSIYDIWSQEKWDHWYNNLDDYILSVDRDKNDHVEVGAAPIRTDQGWLLIYSHIQHYYSDNKVFGVEALLLDLNDPYKIIGRTDGPFMVTQELYEKLGHVEDIVFPSGVMINGDRLQIFYGGADTVGCIASAPLKYVVENTLPANKRTQIVKRYSENPILEKVEGHDWESKAAFNPAAIELNGKIHILYRALSSDDTSTIGYASTADGLRIDERLAEPIYTPRRQFEKKLSRGNSGCEDARIVRIEEQLYITYTAYNGQGPPRVAVSSISVQDFLNRQWNWSTPEVISPDYTMDKNSCIIPEKFGDHYLLFHRVQDDICADYVNSLNFSKEKLDSCLQVMQPRPGMWDGQKIGIAAPPIKINEGWLLLYHGVSEKTEYRVGAALLDKNNPTLVNARTASPIFEPKEPYEQNGIVPNVVFPCGAVIRGDKIYIYYGGADSVVGVAVASLKELLKRLEA